MAENEDIKPEASSTPIPIKGRFDQYRSSYWAAAVAVLGLRYGARPFIRPLWEGNRAAELAATARKTVPWLFDHFKPETLTHFIRHSYAAIAGTIMYGVTAFYAKTTYNDMRSIFAEAVGAEFNKKPEEVTRKDIWASKNTAVIHTRDKFVKYNMRRFAVNTAFFTPFIPGISTFFKNSEVNGVKKGFHAESGADFGIAANGLYLFSDVIKRRATFFESLQAMIDRKVNHADHLDELITARDLMALYEQNDDIKNKHLPFSAQRGEPRWNELLAVFERMAELMNQTYKNTVPTEKANFGFPQFIFLIGNGMIDLEHPVRSLTYVETANQYGLKAVKEISHAAKTGVNFEQATKPFPLAKAYVQEKDEAPHRFTDTVAPAGKNEVLKNKAPAENIVASEEIRRAQAAQTPAGATL